MKYDDLIEIEPIMRKLLSKRKIISIREEFN